MKGSLTLILANQAIDCLKKSVEEKKLNHLDKEVQQSITNTLLLGIILEGLINEIGDKNLDSWTWNELERSTTILKWRIISGLKKDFNPGKEPLQTIVKIKRMRDEIAHPKIQEMGNDIYLISQSGQVEINPKDDFILPKDDFNIYLGFGNLIKKYNSKEALINTKKVFKAIKDIVKLFGIEADYSWVDEIENEVKEIEKLATTPAT